MHAAKTTRPWSLRVGALVGALALFPSLTHATVNVYAGPLRAVNETPTCTLDNVSGVNLAVLTTIYDASGTPQCSQNVAIPNLGTSMLTCPGLTGLSTCVSQVDTNAHADNLRMAYILQDANGGTTAAASGTRQTANFITPLIIASSQTGSVECAVVNGSTSQLIQVHIGATTGGNTSSGNVTVGPNQVASVSVAADGTGTTGYLCYVVGSGNKLFLSNYLQPGNSATDSRSPVTNTP